MAWSCPYTDEQGNYKHRHDIEYRGRYSPTITPLQMAYNEYRVKMTNEKYFNLPAHGVTVSDA